MHTEKNHPIGENSTNLVALAVIYNLQNENELCFWIDYAGT
jgi:hypothetical protein